MSDRAWTYIGAVTAGVLLIGYGGSGRRPEGAGLKGVEGCV